MPLPTTHKFQTVATKAVLVQRLQLDPSTRRSYALDAAVTSEAINQIDMDLPRSNSHDPFIAKRLGVMRSMLLRQMAEDPELGYCQGMNFVAASFAVAFSNQTEAYAHFHAFIQRMRGLWLPGFPLLQEGIACFEEIASRCSWFKHLKQQGVETSMYIPQAWMTLFVTWFPLKTIVCCLPQLETNGFVGVMAMTLAFLDHLESSLVKASGVEEILPILHDSRDSTPPAVQLAMKAGAWAPSVIVVWNQFPSTRPVKKKVPLKRQGSRVVDEKGEGVCMVKNWNLSTAAFNLKSFNLKAQGEAGAALFSHALSFVQHLGVQKTVTKTKTTTTTHRNFPL